MLHVNTVLHPTDFSDCADAAFVHALHLARRYGAALHVLHVQPTLRMHHLHDALGAIVDEDALDERFHAEAEAQYRALLDTFETEDLRIRWVPRKGLRTATAILDYAKAEDIDLVVVGTHGRRGLRHLLLGSVAEELVRLAPCPVWTVRAPNEDEQAGVTLLTPRRLLVPIDFSPYSHDALRHACALAGSSQARLDLLHVIDPVQQPAFYETGLVHRNALEERLRTTALDELQAFFERIDGPKGEVVYHVRTGYPPREITALAGEQRTDLLVISTHGLRGLRRYPLGSVAERVVREATCPVLVTRPFGKSLLRSVSAKDPCARSE